MKLKVCGMKHPENIKQLTDIQPGYIGFIFYPKSKRYMADSLQSEVLHAIPSTIKKVGVFVNESINSIENSIKNYRLDLIQLHGDESVDFCKELSEKGYDLIKAFQVDENFKFEKLEAYKKYCKFFLFDTKTPLYGGSGHKFDWQLLKNYDNEKPFFLSGGIDLEDANEIRNIKNLNIHAVDINSKFEIEPGLKNIEKIKKFNKQLLHRDKLGTTEIHREN
jgi:phosphoribosylanthranilate isomerase